MNIRSIYFRLISWYTCLITIICIAFGAYTYNGLKSHLDESMNTLLNRRTALLSRVILSSLPEKNISYVTTQIKTIFTTEENNRFMRITDDKGKILFISGTPRNEQFNPAEIPALIIKVTSPTKRFYKLSHKNRLIILSSPYETKDGRKLTIEVGEINEANNNILRALEFALYLGLPFVIIFTAGGGYLLVKNALRPVENLSNAAENITLNNLKERLPVEKTGDSIEKLSNTLNRMIVRLDSSYQQVRRFSADASHELRTPLTVMRGELESIMFEPSVSEDVQDRLGNVLEETTRLSDIAQGLFALSRLDAGEARMQTISVDIGNLAKVTLDQMRLLADEKEIRVNCTVESNIKVQGDPARLKQIIVNLLDNAIKYTSENGHVFLKVTTANKNAILEVADNGIGISNEDKPKIFERFYRADKVRSRDLGGAGLGLAIVKSICVAHNGDIRVESTEGQGSKFIVELPLA